MKKNFKALLFLPLTALLLTGCSKTQNTSNYLMLVSKEFPLPENYTNTFKLVTADTVYEGEKTQVMPMNPGTSAISVIKQLPGA